MPLAIREQRRDDKQIKYQPALFRFDATPDFQRLLALRQVQRQPSERRNVLRRVSAHDRAPVLPERRARRPVKTVLNPPMLSDCPRNPVRLVRVDSIIAAPFMFAHSPRSFACPTTDGVDAAQASAALYAPMPLVHGLEYVMLYAGEPRPLAVFRRLRLCRPTAATGSS